MSKVYIILLSRDLKNKKVGHHPPSTIQIKKSLGSRVRMDTERIDLASFLPGGITVNTRFSWAKRFG